MVAEEAFNTRDTCCVGLKAKDARRTVGLRDELAMGTRSLGYVIHVHK